MHARHLSPSKLLDADDLPKCIVLLIVFVMIIFIIFMYNTLSIHQTELVYVNIYVCFLFVWLKIIKRRIKTEAVLLQGEQIVGKTIILWSETKENKLSKLPR